MASSLRDADGVMQVLASAPGAAFRLGELDPNEAPGVKIEKGVVAVRMQEGGLSFWRMHAYGLNYSSGGQGKTSRVHVYASGGAQTFNWLTQRGYLATPRDLKNQEFTVYVRVHGIFDRRRAAVSLKIRGGRHTKSDGDLASCTMMTFAPGFGKPTTRFGKELHHPDYDYVGLERNFDASLQDNRWVGLKLVSYQDPKSPQRVINRLYVDPEPFDDQGRPKNGFRLFSEYTDVEGRNTGQYHQLVNWGGFQTTLRTDGVDTVDFALLSLREIEPPG